MSRKDKSADADQHKRQAPAAGQGPKGLARPEADARGWAALNKLHDGGKKGASRRKLPSGPLGGSGRKTNLSRSS